jgi:hypothetical protein
LIVKEFEHRGQEYIQVFKPLGNIIGRLGPDNVAGNRLKIRDYLEKYFPHLKQK